MRFTRDQALLALGLFGAAIASLCLLPRLNTRPISPLVPESSPPAASSNSSTPSVPLEARWASSGPDPADNLGGTNSKYPGAFAAALSRALSKSDSEERETLISAALYAWARDDLEAASVWARGATVLPRAKAIAALVNGAAAADTTTAIRYVERLSAGDAEHAAEYGNDLIFALAQAGNASAAARWTEENKIVDINWVTDAFERWASVEPEAALLHAVAMINPSKRRAAVDAAISGWSKTEPKSLADYAANFPAGPEKNLAVVAALRAWADIDPKATADWMIAHRSAIESVPNLATINDD